MISSNYQAKYVVHELERVYANDDVAKLSGLMFDAQITPAPHQVDAALFALNSPNTRGVMMADEVGLGKTIEAGIVIMQYWAERKRDILIIAPSSLRQQWAQELQEKFNLSTQIIDSKFMKTKKLVSNHIYICSYEFANRHADKLSRGWDLLVLDEAHKLRNFHKNKKGIASSIAQIARGSTRSLLLTATPLQNNLMELYGLVSVVDPSYFHSLEVFKERYIKSENPYSLEDLRSRMSKIAKRTLRNDAKKYIKYTDRIARTIRFHPSGEEKRLYDLIDDYLRRDRLYAFAKSQRHLSALIIRKRLGSSTFAVASTLRNIINRMEEEYSLGKVRDNRGGLMDFDDLTDDELEYYEANDGLDDRSLESAIEREKFRAEINELRGYAKLAESIKSNVKAEHLVEAINVGFNTLETKAAKKAIIFTESTRTQEYIAKTLEENGFSGKYILFNGSNNSPEANKTYNEWKIKNRDTDLITGIETADRRKALIDKFREDDTQIMIATEAASEGINLQFCSMLINYDLPWNPQRVEQRVGRIHRIGQKYDVVVVNFSNQGNLAELRILDLLANKFQLFKSTFGVSNSVLGAIEDGVDFEKKISEILNTCRSDAEIDQGFERLQNEFKEEIAKDHAATRVKIFDGLDPHVQDRFKRYDQQTKEAFNTFERLFINLTRFELRDFAKFKDDRIFTLSSSPDKEIDTGAYFFKTDRIPHARQYKYSGNLAEYVRRQAKLGKTPPAKLTFDISSSDRISTSIKKMAGHSGTMVVRNVKFEMKVGQTDMSESYVVAAAQLEDNSILDHEICQNILDLNVVNASEQVVVLSDELDAGLMQNIDSLHNEVKGRNTDALLDKKDLLERQFMDRVVELEIKIDALEAKVKEKDKQERQAPNSAERLKIAGEKQTLRKKIRILKQNKFTLEESAEDDIDEKVALAQQANSGQAKIEKLFVINFEIK